MIRFDAAATGSQSGGTITFSHTCLGVNRILFVGGTTPNSGNDQWSSVTYNGVAMTRITTVIDINNDIRGYLYYLINPSKGSHNVVVTTNGNVDTAASVSYKGAQQSGQPDASASAASNGATSIATTLNTVANNCWNLSFVGSSGGGTSASTGINATRASGNSSIGDSNGPLTPAGAYAMTWTSGSQKLVAIQASIVPGGPSDLGGAFIFNMI